MKNTIYTVLSISPDGDNYSIHENLQSACAAFNENLDTDDAFKPDACYVLEVEFGKEFGFGAYNEFYGVHKVHKAYDETMVE
jgi:hypothetical protein